MMRKGVWEEGSWNSPTQSSAQPQKNTRSPGKPWFAHFFSLCPSYFKSFLNYPRILHLEKFWKISLKADASFSLIGRKECIRVCYNIVWRRHFVWLKWIIFITAFGEKYWCPWTQMSIRRAMHCWILFIGTFIKWKSGGHRTERRRRNWRHPEVAWRKPVS